MPLIVITVVFHDYDIIRRKRGHLGIAFQIDLFETEANISAAAQRPVVCNRQQGRPQDRCSHRFQSPAPNSAFI